MPGLHQVGAQKHECTCHRFLPPPTTKLSAPGLAVQAAKPDMHSMQLKTTCPAGLNMLSKQSPAVMDSKQPGMVLVRSVIQHHLPRSDTYCLTLHLPHDQGSDATNGGSPARFHSHLLLLRQACRKLAMLCSWQQGVLPSLCCVCTRSQWAACQHARAPTIRPAWHAHLA